jgi:hypothetical protein
LPDLENGPRVTELARRVLRVEALLDERIATVDMLRSSEKLVEAREVANAATTQALDYRLTRLEISNSRLTYMLVGAFLGLLVQAIILVLTITSKGAT